MNIGRRTKREHVTVAGPISLGKDQHDEALKRANDPTVRYTWIDRDGVRHEEPVTSKRVQAIFARQRTHGDALRQHAIQLAEDNPVTRHGFDHPEVPEIVELQRTVAASRAKAAHTVSEVMVHVIDSKTGRHKEIPQSEYLARKQENISGTRKGRRTERNTA